MVPIFHRHKRHGLPSTPLAVALRAVASLSPSSTNTHNPLQRLSSATATQQHLNAPRATTPHPRALPPRLSSPPLALSPSRLSPLVSSLSRGRCSRPTTEPGQKKEHRHNLSQRAFLPPVALLSVLSLSSLHPLHPTAQHSNAISSLPRPSAHSGHLACPLPCLSLLQSPHPTPSIAFTTSTSLSHRDNGLCRLPITQVPEQPVASSSSSPITQVSQSQPMAPLSSQYYTPGQASYPSKLILDLHGTRFEIDRDTLVSLPESILIVMFPNGLILRPQANTSAKGRTGAGTGAGAGAGTGAGSGLRGSGGHHPSDSTYTSDYSDYSDYSYDDYDEDDDDYQYGREESGDHEEELEDEEHSEEEEEVVIQVDFDPACLQYILDFYRQAHGARDALRRLHLQEQQQRQMQQRQQQQQQQTQQQQQQGGSKDEGSSRTTAAEGRPPSTESSTSSVSQPVPLSTMAPQNPLLNKQAIIVLREELDYFAIPPASKNKNTPAAQKSSRGSQATASTTIGPEADDTSTQRDSAEGLPALLGATPSSMPVLASSSSAPGSSSSKNTTTTTTAPLSITAAAAAATGPQAGSGQAGSSAKSPLMIKTQCGRILLEDRKIFAALQRNISKEKNQAEQHLMDMLCVSGFQKDGEWGYRKLESKRTTVVSVAMVMLRTTATAATATATTPSSTVPSSNNDPQQHGASSTEPAAVVDGSLQGAPTAATATGSDEKDSNNAQGDPKPATTEQSQGQESSSSASQRTLDLNQNQMAIAQKLLLFWRKPARKCWWDGIQVEIESTGTTATSASSSPTTDTSSVNENNSHSSSSTGAKVPVRLWARRTWTLELVLI
ncbi:unnamed protein product [Mortierella alpina]